MTTSPAYIRNSFGAVIINWNAERVIVECVRSFIAGGVAEENIVVVDNGSTDGSRACVAKEFPEIRILDNPINSYSRAVNLGVASLRLPFVVIANPDLMIDPDCLLHVARLFRDNDGIGAAGCRLSNESGENVTRFSHTSVFRAVGLLIIPTRWRGIIRRREQRQNPSAEPFPVTYIEGSFTAVRREAFASVRGFDERYAFFHEDSDFCIRLSQSGWRLFHCPAAHATHFCGLSFNQNPDFRLQQFYKNTLLLFRQHYPARYPILVAGVFLLLFLKILAACVMRPFDTAAGKRFDRLKTLLRIIRQ